MKSSYQNCKTIWTQKKTRFCYHGFTLLEVLITLIILSVGLLGLASIQSLGLSHSNNSHFRNIATIQANAMADSIRANRAGYEDGHYNDIQSSNNYTNPNCISTTTGCTAQQLANYDAFIWLQNLSFELPQGEGSVLRNGNEYTITVSWSEKDHKADADGNNAGQLKVNTQSHSIVIKP
ncbi:MAG: type IV pilus modification protein PilV [Pseudomonadota bacterium]